MSSVYEALSYAETESTEFHHQIFGATAYQTRGAPRVQRGN